MLLQHGPRCPLCAKLVSYSLCHIPTRALLRLPPRNPLRPICRLLRIQIHGLSFPSLCQLGACGRKPEEPQSSSSSAALCARGSGAVRPRRRCGSSCLFCLAPTRSGTNASKCSLGKRAGIPRAVWLAPGPLGVMMSSCKCMYANREPMLTALQEVEWWAKHAPTALQQS